MKNFKRILCTLLAIAVIAVPFTVTVSVSAAGNLHWNKGGSLYYWDCTDQPDNVSGTAPLVEVAGTAADDGIHTGMMYAPYNAKSGSVAQFYPKMSQNAENPNAITTGAIDLSFELFIPSEQNTLTEGMYFIQYLDLWPRNYKTHAIPVSINNRGGNLSIGFNKSWWGVAPSYDNGIICPLDADKWYKADVVINYDKATVDYYLDGTYVGCATAGFSMEALGFDELWWYSQTDSTSLSKQSTFWFKDIRVDELASEFTAKFYGNGKDYIDLLFNSNPVSDDITKDTFSVSSGDGADYTVKSAEIVAKKVVRITLNEEIDTSATLNIFFNNDIQADSLVPASASAGTSYVFIPQAAKAEERTVLENDFESTTFPTKETSASFNDFYCQYEREDNPFTTKKDYTWENVTSVSSGGNTALAFHRSSENPSSKYWGDNETVGLVIPFPDGDTIKDGKFTIELDAGKKSEKSVNADVFTVGLHDKNNEITEYDKNTAWSNSTAFLQNGDYYETAQILFKPNGRSGGYSWVYKSKKDDAAKTKAALWPANPNVQYYTVGEVYHFKIDADLTTGKYDVYKDGDKIGNQLDIPTTANAPEYDAMVIGMGLDYRDTATEAGTARYIYIDNIKVSATSSGDSVSATDITANGEPFNYCIGADSDIDVTFNKNIDASSIGALVNGVSLTSDKISVSGNKVTLNTNGVLAQLTDYKIELTGLKSAGSEDEGSTFSFSFATLPDEYEWTMDIEKTSGGAEFTANAKGKDDEEEFVLVLAAYKLDDGVPSLSSIIASPTKTGSEATLTATGDDFKNADILKGYVFDGLSTLIPRCAPCVK